MFLGNIWTVLYCSKYYIALKMRKRQLTKDDRPTIITLNMQFFPFQRNCKESQGVTEYSSPYTIKRHLGWKLGLPDLLLSVSSKATTESEDKFLRVNSLCDKQLTEHLQAQLNTDRSKQVSVLTVKRRLQAAGLTGQVAVRKPLLRWQTKKKRLAWAMKHRQWSTEDRKAHGQMQFDIFCSTGRVFVHH